jgi:hypothetical protein
MSLVTAVKIASPEYFYNKTLFLISSCLQWMFSSAVNDCVVIFK